MAIFRFIFAILGIYFLIVMVVGMMYIVVPPVSTLMFARWVTFNGVEHDNVPLKSINRNLLRAVITAEDDEFCSHWGVNLRLMDKAIQKVGKKRSHGASTIPMQVAKNLFLWPERSYTRKILELPIAIYLNLIWSKKRMMEVYLSVAEWGDGVFGAEAAASKYFNKSASKLTEKEAALLAAALPNPIKRHPNKPSAYMNKYAGSVLSRMGRANLSCL